MTHYDSFFADGRFHRTTGTSTTVVVNPATDEPIGEVRFCSAPDLDSAICSAQRAATAWAGSGIGERREALQRLSLALQARSEAFVQALAAEIGCPVWLGRLMQVPMALKDLEFTIAGLDQITWVESIGNGLVERMPVGVIAAITPWNFPVHQIVAKVAGALAAGCSVVLKPSEVAPGAAHLFMEAVAEAKLVPGLVNLVWGDAELGASLVGDARIQQISFTGSTAVGRRIMAAASHRLVRVTLELGGKSAAVLLDDADLDAALPVALRIGLANSGQACVSQSRLIVPRSRQDEICERLRNLLLGWPLGNPFDEATRLGPVANAAQWASIDRRVAQAIEQGAKLVYGGRGRPEGFPKGNYISPTIFRDVNPSMAVAQEEVFGPVIAVMPADNDDEALAIANSSLYGLSGAIWSRDRARALEAARRMRTGQVVINGAAQNLATPFGGWGHSGFGRENGRFGIEECLQYRSLHGAVG